MLKSLLFLLPIVLKATQIEWPFFAEDDDLYLSLSIGTPPQPIKVSLRYFYTSNDLQVLSAQIGGDYNNTASSTWKYYQKANSLDGTPIGLSGFENFQLGNFNLKNGSFVLRNTSFELSAYMGFGYSYGYYTFLQSLTDNFIQKKIFFAFDSGTITLGSIDRKRCFNNWHDLKMKYWNKLAIYKWGVEIESISAGNISVPISSDSKHGKLVFGISSGDEMEWPKDVYSQIIKGLGSTDDEFVPCDTTIPIIFKVEDFKIQLKPADYLDTGMPDGKCKLIGETREISADFMLPQFFFKDYCMGIDNDKYVVAIATRRPEKPL